MKVLEEINVNGIDVQREDWSENYDFHNYGDTIAFYPRTKGYSYWVKPGDKIRFDIMCKSTEQAENFMNDLQKSKMTLRELIDFAANEKLFYEYTGKNKDIEGNTISLDQIDV